MDPEKISELLESISGGYRSPDHDLIVQSNLKLLLPHVQLGVIVHNNEYDNDNDALATQSNCNKMYCSEPGCDCIFDRISDFETHFNSLHRYICNECKRSLPTPHLLDLHLTETHDSYFAAKLTRGTEPLYACFLETCSLKMNTPEERKEHCMKAHKFPANYRFDQSKTKVSQLKQIKQNPKNAQDLVSEKACKQAVTNNVFNGKMIHFGHPKERVFATYGNRRTDHSLEDVKDLKDALAEIE